MKWSTALSPSQKTCVHCNQSLTSEKEPFLYSIVLDELRGEVLRKKCLPPHEAKETRTESSLAPLLFRKIFFLPVSTATT